jgi:stringent starvation protein B
MSVATKKAVALAILERTTLHIHLDPRRPGVVVPRQVSSQPSLTLAVAHAGLRIAIPDLVVDDEGIRATLSFGNQPFACVIPWSAVYGLADPTGKGSVYKEDAPPDLPPPTQHHEECSFCLATRAQVNFLVAADAASICDACVAKHRPRGFWDVVRGWFAPKKRAVAGTVVMMPYRGAPAATCSFCRAVAPSLVAGAKAQICPPCLKLAAHVVREGVKG